jgi:hypothetical protein
VEQFETATCRPKHILHIKIGVGTAGGAVSNLRAVASEGPLFKKKNISFNFHESLSVAHSF